MFEKMRLCILDNILCPKVKKVKGPRPLAGLTCKRVTQNCCMHVLQTVCHVLLYFALEVSCVQGMFKEALLPIGSDPVWTCHHSTGATFQTDQKKLRMAEAPEQGNSRLSQAQAQVGEVVDIMRVNVEKVLERDSKLSELDQRADNLQEGANQFQTQVRH